MSIEERLPLLFFFNAVGILVFFFDPEVLAMEEPPQDLLLAVFTDFFLDWDSDKAVFFIGAVSLATTAEKNNCWMGVDVYPSLESISL